MAILFGALLMCLIEDSYVENEKLFQRMKNIKKKKKTYLFENSSYARGRNRWWYSNADSSNRGLLNSNRGGLHKCTLDVDAFSSI